MDVSAVASSVTQASAKASNGLADNFDTFLTLLTTQLKNQDPLSPMESAEFTNQLVQFSSVEQSIQSNKYLESLISLTSTNASTSALGYIGREVVFTGNQVKLSGGSASWTYEVDPKATSSAITVKNAAGKVVYSGAGETGNGIHAFTWNGKDVNGIAQPNGIYTVSMGALDDAKKALNVKVFSKGIVDAVETLDGKPVLTVGGVKVSIGSIMSVAAPVSTPNTSNTGA